MDRQRTRRRRGFVLIFFALVLVVLLGAAGLTVDVGRMYITKNEAQSYCDAASIAAALKLDGTSAGISNATNAATSLPKKWNFGTTPFSGPAVATTVDFAQTSAGPWSTAPASPAGYVVARVTASVTVPTMLMPVLTGESSAAVGASAVAMQLSTPSMNNIFPFGPLWIPRDDAGTVPSGSVADPNDPFNMVPARVAGNTYQQGGVYELQGQPSDTCGGGVVRNDYTTLDRDYRDVSLANSDRGYIWDSRASDRIRGAILGNEVPVGESISVGQSVVDTCQFCYQDVSGQRTTEIRAIQDRVAGGGRGGNTAPGDTDPISPNYMTYYNDGQGTGNNQRVVVMPIITGACNVVVDGQLITCPEGFGPFTVLGFGAFFLLPAADYGNHSAICAEYIGPWVPNQAAGGGGGAFVVKLVR